MIFSTPGGHEIRVPLSEEKIHSDGPHYNVRRKLFDGFLFQAAKKQRTVKALEGFQVLGVLKENGRVVGVNGLDFKGRRRSFFASVVVGADGSQSVVAKSAGINPVVAERHATNARVYFKGVSCDRHAVELHYLEGVNPGYFWIFPVDGGLCNVGVGLRTQDVQRRRLNPVKELTRIIDSPRFRTRFSKARQIVPVGVWGVTVGGTKKRPFSGAGFVLCGDAANTAVTFAGEGVGPAMRSGKIAAEQVGLALHQGDVSAKSLRRYDDVLWRIIGPENRAMASLEFLIKNPAVFDFAVKRGAGRGDLAKLASDIASDYRNAARIWSPSTLFKLLGG